MTDANSKVTHKLLIVDDSKVSRMRIHAYFSSNCPTWEIREATSGDDAVEIFGSFKPTYVTMDVNMPGISGFEAARLMTAANPDIKIVMLTANVQDSSKRMASSLQLKFVGKPVVEASLSQVLQFLTVS